jgi:excisionase family DNA binding protein
MSAATFTERPTRGESPEILAGNGLRELVSVPTLAMILDVKEKTIRKWVAERRIPFHKLGKLVRFHVGEIRSWYGGQKMDVVTRDIIREKAA